MVDWEGASHCKFPDSELTLKVPVLNLCLELCCLCVTPSSSEPKFVVVKGNVNIFWMGGLLESWRSDDLEFLLILKWTHDDSDIDGILI